MRFFTKNKIIDTPEKAIISRQYMFARLCSYLHNSSVLLSAVLAVVIMGVTDVYAASYTWDGGGATNNWSDCNNWSSNICPVAADTVTFNGTSTKNSVVDSGFGGTVAGVTIASGYTGTISLDRSLASTGVFTQAAGSTFSAGSHDLFVASTFTLNATGTFNAGTGRVVFNGTSSGILTCANKVFNSVAFEHTAGTKTVQTGCNFPIGSDPLLTANVTMNGGQLLGSGTIITVTNLTLNSGVPFSGFSGLVTNGSLIVSGSVNANFSTYDLLDINSSFTLSGTSTFTAPSDEMSVSSSISFSGGTFNANGGTLVLDGISSATYVCNNVVFSKVIIAHTSNTRTINSGCNFPLGSNPVIASSVSLSGGSLSGSGTLTYTGGTFTLAGTLNGFSAINANLMTVSSNQDLSSYDSLITQATLTISSNITFIAPASSSMSVGAGTSGNLVINSGATFTAPTDSLTVNGSVNINSSATFNHNDGTVIIAGGNATISCSGAPFNLLIIQGTGTKTIGTNCSVALGDNPTIQTAITLNGSLTGSGKLTITAGTFTVSNAAPLSGFNSLEVNAMALNNGTVMDLASYSSADINGAFTINNGAKFTAPETNLSVAGNFTIGTTADFHHNNGTIIFDGGAATLNCNNATFNKIIFDSGTSAKGVGSTCTFPLGNNPIINGRITLNGTLTGSGIVTDNQVIIFNSSAALNGFGGWVSNNTFTINGANVDFGNYSVVDINAFFNFASGIFTAPSGVMNVSSHFLDSDTTGTFNHNNGTVIFDGEGINQYINASVTFNNFTAMVPSQVTFKAGQTTTVLGKLILKGESTTEPLILASSTPGTQWNIDAKGERDLRYLSVQDSNNINTEPMLAYDSQDLGNNINWQFPVTPVPEVPPVSPNPTPTAPSGPIESTGGVTNFGFAQASINAVAATQQQTISSSAQATFGSSTGINGALASLNGIMDKFPGGNQTLKSLLRWAAIGLVVLILLGFIAWLVVSRVRRTATPQSLGYEG